MPPHQTARPSSDASRITEVRHPAKLMRKLALIKEQLGIGQALPLVKAVAEANEKLGLLHEGTLVRQVDALMKTLELSV